MLTFGSILSSHFYARFLRMSSLCQGRADTNLTIEKFYLSIFPPVRELSVCGAVHADFAVLPRGYLHPPLKNLVKKFNILITDSAGDFHHP